MDLTDLLLRDIRTWYDNGGTRKTFPIEILKDEIARRNKHGINSDTTQGKSKFSVQEFSFNGKSYAGKDAEADVAGDKEKLDV